MKMDLEAILERLRGVADGSQTKKQKESLTHNGATINNTTGLMVLPLARIKTEITDEPNDTLPAEIDLDQESEESNTGSGRSSPLSISSRSECEMGNRSCKPPDEI